MDFINQVMPYVVSVVAACAAYLVAYIKNKQTNLALAELKESLKEGNYYIICPECKTKIYLQKVDLEEE